MADNKKFTMKCDVCKQEIDTKKEIVYRTYENDEGTGGIIICEKWWEKNSPHYLEKYPIISRLNVKEGEKFEFINIKRKCDKCGNGFLTDIGQENLKDDAICSSCKTNDNKLEISKIDTKSAETKQQSTGEINKKNEGMNGGIIVLIILVVASVLGGIFYYFWNKRKINK